LLARRRFYASQINLSQKAWDQGQPARVVELLEGQRPKFDQTDLRTFEWYYLWRRCHVDCRLDLHLDQTPGPFGAALAPDGKTLALGCWNSYVKFWDVPSGRERATLRGHWGAVASLAFSPDGKTLVSGSLAPDSNLKVWEVATGKERIVLRHQTWIRSLAFARDGKTLASGGEDGTVKLWNVATWQEEITLHGHSGPVLCVTFSPDGKTLASASSWGKDNGLVNLWDMSAKPVKTRLRIKSVANTVAFAPDGKTLAGAWEDVRLWDVATGLERAVYTTNAGRIDSVAFSPDGKTLAIGNADRTVKLWELGSDRERSYAHHNKVGWVAFSADGKTVTSGSGLDGAVKLWNVAPAQEPATVQQKGEVISVAFSPDGKVLASGGSDSTKLWDVASSRETATLQPGNAVFSHDGKTLAISNWYPLSGVAGNPLSSLP
jgi:WD40 repeat protein